MRSLRRALLLLGLLSGLLAMHGLAPSGGTDVLATGPHPHPAALFDPADPMSGVAADPVSAAVPTDGPDDAVPGAASLAGSPQRRHDGHGAHLDGMCLGVLLVLLTLALADTAGRNMPAATGLLRRCGPTATAIARPPDLSRLCLLRI